METGSSSGMSRNVTPQAPPSEFSRHMLLITAGMLLAVGTLMVYSASITARPSDQDAIYLHRHIFALVVAGAAGVVVAHIPAAVWRRAAPLLHLIVLALLVVVLVPSIGTSVNGARRWIRMGGVSLQPSELAKITIPLLVGSLLVTRQNELRRRFLATLTSWVVVGVTVALIFREPDLGTAAFVVLGAMLTFWYAGWATWKFLLLAMLAVPAVAVCGVLRPYQLQRIQGFIAAWGDLDEAPYQVKQALTTLGAGGVTGVGLGRGWQKLSFLPEANTDFIFAVIGEELGLLGTLGIVVLWAALFIFGSRSLRHLPSTSFAAVAGRVLLAELILQAIANMAVVTALLPPKGIPHPFLSYGGSSLVVSTVMVGMIVGFNRAGGDSEEASPQQTDVTDAVAETWESDEPLSAVDDAMSPALH